MVFTIQSYQGGETLESILRDVRLYGDASIKPYATAQIKIIPMRFETLRPTAYYVLEENLEAQRKIRDLLQTHQAISLFALTGLLKYQLDGITHFTAPPIIETYYEPQEAQIVSAIVDGLHRISLARELGLEKMWVVEISHIPPEYPLVPLPLHWEDVKQVKSVPPNNEKRKFRFARLEDFPDVSAFSEVNITEENYLYFFYRVLSKLGSQGIRSE